MATPIRIKDFPNEETTPANSDFLALDNGVTAKISRENLLKGTPLPADTVDTQAIANASVTADKLGLGQQSAILTSSQSTTSSTYTDLATVGPVATVTIGASGTALVAISCGTSTNTVGNWPLISFAVSGATTLAASDAFSVGNQGASSAGGSKVGAAFLVTGLTPGSNTFTAKYRLASGSSGTNNFSDRRISVVPL